MLMSVMIEDKREGMKNVEGYIDIFISLTTSCSMTSSESLCNR